MKVRKFQTAGKIAWQDKLEDEWSDVNKVFPFIEAYEGNNILQTAANKLFINKYRQRIVLDSPEIAKDYLEEYPESLEHFVDNSNNKQVRDIARELAESQMSLLDKIGAAISLQTMLYPGAIGTGYNPSLSRKPVTSNMRDAARRTSKLGLVNAVAPFAVLSLPLANYLGLLPKLLPIMKGLSAAYPYFKAYTGIEAAHSLAGKNGVRKTVNEFSKGNKGAGTLSLAGDLLSASLLKWGTSPFIGAIRNSNSAGQAIQRIGSFFNPTTNKLGLTGSLFMEGYVNRGLFNKPLYNYQTSEYINKAFPQVLGKIQGNTLTSNPILWKPGAGLVAFFAPIDIYKHYKGL